MPRAAVVLVAATALLAGACGVNGSAAAQPKLIDVVPTPTLVPEPSPVPTATPVPTPTPTPNPSPTPVFEVDAEVLSRLPPGWDPIVVVANQDGPTQDAPGGGRIGPLGTSSNRWRYTGVLGRLKPKQALVPAVADAPVAVPDAAPLTGVPAWETTAIPDPPA
ncbi:MAG: hypothetical protein ACC660_02375, partial [Acidimicrobiales bacterium]